MTCNAGGKLVSQQQFVDEEILSKVVSLTTRFTKVSFDHKDVYFVKCAIHMQHYCMYVCLLITLTCSPKAELRRTQLNGIGRMHLKHRELRALLLTNSV